MHCALLHHISLVFSRRPCSSEQAFFREHYTTIEADPEANPQSTAGGASSPPPSQRSYDQSVAGGTDLDATVGNDGYIKLGDEEYSIAELEV